MVAPLDADFRAAMASFASGVTIVTTLDENGAPLGLTATAFSSVCRTPPTCLVCIDLDAEAEPVIERRGRFAVNVLAAGSEAMSNRFATKGADKFGPTAWEPGPALGLPILPDAIASFECDVSERRRIGDHTVFFGVLRSVVTRDGEPLLYFRGRYRTLSAD